MPDIKPMLNLNIFDSVKSNRVSDIIIGQIRRAIVQGKIKPGDRLPPEHVLIEKFQTSKFSVREALRSLEILGFLEIKKGPSGGAVITKVDFRPIKNSIYNFIQFQNLTVQNVFEVRMMIETGGVENVVIRPDKEPGFSANNLRDHWEIFKAIEEGNPQRAMKVMTAHLKEVEKRLKPLERKLKLVLERKIKKE